ncbi:methyltransferase family protein [Burkholderia sp. Ch1-1]|uniref:Methyltransferase family protein n=1 Tax=Paraburkholderia dioscoreae TaxID=2604047 RepID=A0A5Q4YYS2_9BURK|nr:MULTISPECIES: methyltransferase domain-containing protein [Paraburkholderia]EIF35301.1 methyltransferase family protein [Burkholderia sp. Ch1-1]VVD34534.1 Methyltransferase family protein [Paraburkholderia dioscoreae]
MAYAIDRLETFRSHVFCEGWFSGLAERRGSISVMLDGKRYQPVITAVNRPDVAAAFGRGAEKWGFRLSCRIDARDGWYGRIGLILSDGKTELRVDDPAREVLNADCAESSAAEAAFFESVRAADNPAILEIGSRARSGNNRRALFPASASYVGFDIVAGENVDIVGDAHFLSQTLPANHFDYIYTISTFEHLMMPWKVAVEMNKVMKTGGIGFIQSHQSWPVHDAPWDFYRFSKFGWHGIFNQFTGFEVVTSAQSNPAAIIPQTQIDNPATFLENETGYLASMCVIKKVAPCNLSWDADPGTIMKTAYPG